MSGMVENSTRKKTLPDPYTLGSGDAIRLSTYTTEKRKQKCLKHNI
jgi:hypothetical protein